MNPTNIILTGLPRSGTTLTCQLLNMLPDTVALHEPMRGAHVAGDGDDVARAQTIARFFAEQRDSILTRGRAASRTADGVMPENPFGTERTESGLRRHLDTKGEIVIAKALSPDFTLVIKHIASFAAMVETLTAHFPVYAVIRNPLAVLASWATLDAPLQDGHIGPAEKLDAGLRLRLAALDDRLERQIALLDWFFAQFDRHLPERSIIRYEALIASGGQTLSVIRPEAAQLQESLTSRNANALYDHFDVIRAGDRLLAADGAFWRFYPKSSVEQLLEAFAAAARTARPAKG